MNKNLIYEIESKLSIRNLKRVPFSEYIYVMDDECLIDCRNLGQSAGIDPEQLFESLKSILYSMKEISHVTDHKDSKIVMFGVYENSFQDSPERESSSDGAVSKILCQLLKLPWVMISIFLVLIIIIYIVHKYIH